MKLIFLTLLISTLIFTTQGCVTIYNPATERSETLLINTTTEVSMGEDMALEIEKKYKVNNDPKLQARLASIGQKVAAASDRQDLKYHFKVVKDKDLNAFAIPGGFIYVNDGLMNVATDDELACVLAHEIGHIAARHSVKKLQSAMGYQLLTGLAFGLTGAQTMNSAMDIVYGLIGLGYSRQDETLADKLAVKYALKSRYNPYAMISFFDKIQVETKTKGVSATPEFLRSHPETETRKRNIVSFIEYYKTNPL